MGTWKSKNRHKYLLQYHIIFVCKYRKKLLVSRQISDDIKQFSYEICQRHSVIIRYMETEHVELAHITQNTGIDLGIKELCITSAGKKYENPKIIRKYEKKLVKLQRQLAHKEKRSQNYCKTKSSPTFHSVVVSHFNLRLASCFSATPLTTAFPNT